MLLFCAIWINAKFLRALNKTLKFDLNKDDHDSFGPSRRIAAQIFFKKALWTKQIRFLLMEWASYVAEKIWRNSLSHGNSSGRFLHGPPLNLLQKLYVILANFWIWVRTAPTFFDQELQTSEDWCATNPNPPINRSRRQGFVAGSPSFELTNWRSGECIIEKKNKKKTPKST